MLRRILGSIVVAILFVALVSNSIGAPPPGTRAPSETAGELHVRPGDNKEARLDSRLVEVQAVANRNGAAPALAQAKHAGVPVRGGRVVVTIEATSTDAARADVAALNGEVERTYGSLIRALVPPGRLRALARSSGVTHVRPPLQPLADAVDGEGVGATNAAAWQALGRTGTGAKVAIIDLGFAGYTSAQANGDLPAVTTVNYCTPPFPGADPHGTAVAEVVHEVAPGAALTLICIEDETSLAQAEAYVKAHGITIVNHSVSWWGRASRGDGTGGPGTPDAIVADARANGVLWVNSAGNYAQRHWSGAFNDTNADGYHDFTAGDIGNSFWVPSGGDVCVSLRWDSWPTTAQDFDLYVGRSSDGALIVSSTNLQNGTQAPLEGTCFTNGGPDDWFFAAIYKFAATTKPSFDLFVFGDAYNSAANIQYAVASRSLLEPANSPNALAAGAVCWQTSA